MICTSQISFLLSFRPDGSIANLKEDDFSFPDRLPPQPSKSDFYLTSSHIEPVRATAHSPSESMVTVDPREDVVIPIPLKPTGHACHIDVLAPKSLEPPFHLYIIDSRMIHNINCLPSVSYHQNLVGKPRPPSAKRKESERTGMKFSLWA